MPSSNKTLKFQVGIVVIGRNEGDRLVNCFKSLPIGDHPTVYVDSGSTDDSLSKAQEFGAHVILLDPAVPFTAARARNAGAEHLLSETRVEFIQFIDGDCTLSPGWLEEGIAFLGRETNAAVACGKVGERFPHKSKYNRLCEIEWNVPPGKTEACGGIALYRAKAFDQVGRFDPSLIAGEEPELCFRLRAAGWGVWRLDAEMTMHDAAMTRFSQWWKRARRSGFATAEGWMMHGRSPERYRQREMLRILVWGIFLPAFIAVSAIYSPLLGLGVFLSYPLQILRLAARYGLRDPFSWVRSWFLVIGKFAETVGMLEYFGRRLSNRQGRLIEYK